MSLLGIMSVMCMPGMLLAGNAGIRWIDKNCNLGAFKEVDGPRTGTLRFVNDGPEEVFISNVRPSCGCTGVSYTEDMIAPGDTAVVNVTYNPAGRPGTFDKTVKVYIGKEKDLHVARISGTVIGSPSTLVFNYPVEAGPLRLETLAVKAGEMKSGSSRHLFVNCYNQSADTLRPAFKSSGKALEAGLTPKSIPPGEIGTFGLYLRTSEEKLMGPVEYAVEVVPDPCNPEADRVEIKAEAIIVPDTDKMSVEEIDNGPRAYLVPEFIDLGELAGDGRVGFSFMVLNDGKSDMKVERVYATPDSRKYVEIRKVPGKIKPGKKGEVKGVLNLDELPEGAFRLYVEVLTNDALHPLRTANIVGLKVKG